MTTDDERPLVGDLTASMGHNTNRTDGREHLTGIDIALAQLDSTDEQGDDDSSADEPYPELLTAKAHVLGLPPIRCPVKGCGYDHMSSQGLVGHVPNASGSAHSWENVSVDAVDLHELASRGTHPDADVRALLVGDEESRQETKAAKDVRAVREWCLENVPVSISKLRVYVHPAHKRVEIDPRDWLEGDTFDGFRGAMQGAEAIGFDGRDSVNYVRDLDGLLGRHGSGE